MSFIYGAKTRKEATLAEQIIKLFSTPDYEKAYHLAVACPCMSWLVDIYHKLNGENDIYTVLIESGNFFAHGFAMTFINVGDIPREMTEIAAEFGCPICQCIMFEKTGNEMWAKMAADQGYSDGFYLLGRDREAAELGNREAMYEYGNQCTGQEYWYWMCQAWNPNDGDFLFLYSLEYNDREALCQIGALLPQIEPARRVYLDHCKYVRTQIDTWTLVAKRLNVYKDIRLYIARIIWKNRVYRLDSISPQI